MPNSGPVNALISWFAMSSRLPMRDTFTASTVPTPPNANVAARDTTT